MGDTVLSTEINSRALEIAMKLFMPKLKANIADGLDHIRRHYFSELRSQRLQGPPGIRGTGIEFFSRFKTVFLVPFGGIESMGLEIFTDSKVARLHETGGVVESASNKLAVPLRARSEMFTARGTLKKTYKNPSQIKNVVPIKIGEKTFLAKVKKRSREILPLYVLKRRVRIKPRLEFMKTWDGQENWRIDRINKAVGKTIDEA